MAKKFDPTNRVARLKQLLARVGGQTNKTALHRMETEMADLKKILCEHGYDTEGNKLREKV